jgi:hypothetical protein
MNTMMPLAAIVALTLVAGAAPPALAAPPVPAPAAPAADDSPWPEASFEIFKLAPGKQEAFIRRIEHDDEVRKTGGLPPTQIFIHEDGADWDVLVYKPHVADTRTPAQKAAMAAKRQELGLESGPAYFVATRELFAAHTDTTAYGPITAAQWLGRLDAWRAAHPQSPAP